MMRVLVAIAVILAAAQTPAFACRVMQPNAPSIQFSAPPPDVRADLIVLDVVFEDVNAFPDRRVEIGRARIVTVVQGNARVGADVFLELPSDAACQRAVMLGERSFIIGRMVRAPGFLVLFEPAWVQFPETWRQP